MPKKKTNAIISAIGGAFSAFLGILGLSGFCFCAFPVLAATLALLGVSTLFLSQYHAVFLAIGAILMAASAYSFYRHFIRKSCTCRVKRTNTKNKKRASRD